jgi:predicted HAD superfamily phosphohydrolase YqeG
VDPAELVARGLSVLVLDFDGVLAPHGEDRPLPEIESWLARCAAVFGEERIFILSNRPVPVRAAYFRQAFPGVRFVAGVRKKPFPTACSGWRNSPARTPRRSCSWTTGS